MLQALIVAALVLIAAVYSAWRLASPRQRLWLIDHLPGSVSDAAVVTRLRRKAVAETVGGCGSCAAASPKGHRRARTP